MSGLRTLGLLFIMGGFAWAKLYPVRDNQNTDLIYLSDPGVHLALEEQAIDNAKESIYYYSYLTYDDTAGMRVMKALRRAANRGVPVYAIVEKIGKQNPASFLADSNLKTPPRVILNSRLIRMWAGLTPFDMIHKKVVSIDSGTPNAILFKGGRNHNDVDLVSVDAGYGVRTVDPNLPSLVTDVSRDFENTFHFFRKIFGEVKPVPLTAESKKKLEKEVPPLVVTKQQLEQFHELEKLLAEKLVKNQTLSPMQFRPKTIQYVTNDGLENAYRRGATINVRTRRKYPNDILTQLEAYIKEAQNAHLHSYAIAPLPRIQDALVEMVRDGGEIDFYANGRKAWLRYFYKGMPVHYTYENVLKMMNRSVPNSIRLHILDKDKADKIPEGDSLENRNFLHRKQLLLTLKDGRKITITGSDPLTESPLFNDEGIFIAEDARLTDFLLNQAREENRLFNTLDQREIKRRHSGRSFLYPLCREVLFRKIF